MRAKDGLSTVGLIFCVLIIAVVIFVVLGRYHSAILRAKETLMKAELRNLNANIQLYSIKYGSFPPDIRYLIDRKEFLELKCELDKDNYPLDPFGNRYQYELKTGRVFEGKL